MDDFHCIRCGKTLDDCACVGEMRTVEGSYLEWAGEMIASLRAERDALVWYIHCKEYAPFHKGTIAAWRAIPEATRKEIEGGSDG